MATQTIQPNQKDAVFFYLILANMEGTPKVSFSLSLSTLP